jgi:hypothetical protein
MNAFGFPADVQPRLGRRRPFGLETPHPLRLTEDHFGVDPADALVDVRINDGVVVLGLPQIRVPALHAKLVTGLAQQQRHGLPAHGGCRRLLAECRRQDPSGVNLSWGWGAYLSQ